MKRQRLSVFAMLFFLVLSGLFQSACAASFGEASDARLREVCRVTGAQPIPASDKPTQEEVARWRRDGTNCLQFILDLDNDKQPDWLEYRKCRLAEKKMATEQYYDLITLYANGLGVKRNPSIAISLACENDIVTSWFWEVRPEALEMLHTTKDQIALDEHFELCNYVSSGVGAGECASLEERKKEFIRQRKIAQLAQHWSQEQKIAFQYVEKTQADFFSSHANHETQSCGTSHFENVVRRVSEQKDNFLKDLTQFMLGKFPARETGTVTQSSTRAAKEADRKLNKSYKALMRSFAKSKGVGCDLSAPHIRATQLLWLKYRDSWLDFAKINYPNYPLDEWKLWINMQRVNQLDGVLKLGED